MFKNRFILALGVLSLLLVTMAVSNPFSKASPATVQGASDFYQRHPGWQWAAHGLKAIIPLTGDSAFSDYYQRHPEWGLRLSDTLAASDYFMRHPELTKSTEATALTDYYFRHPELRSN